MFKTIRTWFTKQSDLVNAVMKLEELNNSLSDQAYIDRKRLEGANADLLRAFLFYNNNRVILSPQIQQLSMDETIGIQRKELPDGSLQLEIVDFIGDQG